MHFIYHLLWGEQTLSIQHHTFLHCDSQLQLREAIEQEALFILFMVGMVG